MDKKTVVVAMSGGVDSTVSAALLQQQGYRVIGMTMRIWDRGDPVFDEARDARQMAEKLGIPHHLIDLRREFRQQVVEPFCAEYFSGRTPNPCVLCNKAFKFRLLLEKAAELGGDLLATGHYVRVVEEDGHFSLVKGTNRHKDQSYFLFTLTQDQLRRVCFPVGEMTKSEVRACAASLGLHVADKGDSQDICFIPDGDYIRFLEEEGNRAPEVGEIVHVSGQVLGSHRGTYRYTIGQRRGLGLAWPEPLYVVRIDALNRRIVVGEKPHLDMTEMTVAGTNWIIPEPRGLLRACCRIRYRHHEAPAAIELLAGGRCRVLFDEAQHGVTPGQAAVFYDGDRVLGGGWIE
jgi:tRNA-specific 2-thiouridylase